MTQFLKYIEKPYLGGDRLDSVINKTIGTENEIDRLKTEHFLRIEGMKSEFRNQNRNSSPERFVQSSQNQNLQENLKNSQEKPNLGSNQTENLPNKTEGSDQNEIVVVDCPENSEKSNNTKLLIVFIILFFIVFGLIILLKFTNSSNIIELIKNFNSFC